MIIIYNRKEMQNLCDNYFEKKGKEKKIDIQLFTKEQQQKIM